jgi:hypothetical protein
MYSKQTVMDSGQLVCYQTRTSLTRMKTTRRTPALILKIWMIVRSFKNLVMVNFLKLLCLAQEPVDTSLQLKKLD